ncbi:hypothetical protein ATCVGM07011_754R [Acanthocystis turfacea Chlorella virus GM0701.1]|nr:hypothetical protein ATCVGM07011_754R [Acanthocystis turfacea Chlorella virus GM0701.1]
MYIYYVNILREITFASYVPFFIILKRKMIDFVTYRR